MRGRFFSDRDLKLIHSLNYELIDDWVQSQAAVFKINAEASPTNIYGETDPNKGKTFFPGVDITCWIKKDQINTNYDDYGPDRKQTVNFAFIEKVLKSLNLFPEVGDIVLFNERYHEIDNVVQEQFLGGIEDKSFSIICHTHYARLSKLSIVTRQS